MRVKPKKSLGQNFLIDKNIQNKIINACGLKPSDTVLEIGSGRGELTGLLVGSVNFIYALEIDPFLCEELRDKFKDCKNLKIINKDILKFDFNEYFRKIKNKVKVIGNIPYYISTPIIGGLLKHRDKIEAVFITVQKEFARRISALPGSKDYGSLSCFVQYYTEPRILFSINKNSFFPSPKVDSSLLRLAIREKPAVKPEDEELFFSIIRASFGKRRKTLRNSLKEVVPAEKLKRFFAEYSICPNVRPEDLTLQDFANLSNLQENCLLRLRRIRQ